MLKSLTIELRLSKGDVFNFNYILYKLVNYLIKES
jgi:hypothetical protein